MNTCHAFQHNAQGTTRYRLFPDGIEHLRSKYDTTPAALLSVMMSYEPSAIYNEDNGCWYHATTDRLLAEPGDSSADMGDYIIAVYTEEEATDLNLL
jgi:hypothetical protein